MHCIADYTPCFPSAFKKKKKKIKCTFYSPGYTHCASPRLGKIREESTTRLQGVCNFQYLQLGVSRHCTLSPIISLEYLLHYLSHSNANFIFLGHVTLPSRYRLYCIIRLVDLCCATRRGENQEIFAFLVKDFYFILEKTHTTAYQSERNTGGDLGVGWDSNPPVILVNDKVLNTRPLHQVRPPPEEWLIKLSVKWREYL